MKMKNCPFKYGDIVEFSHSHDFCDSTIEPFWAYQPEDKEGEPFMSRYGDKYGYARWPQRRRGERRKPGNDRRKNNE
jgi:hypothetical protein